jgi:hypothetical protein
LAAQCFCNDQDNEYLGVPTTISRSIGRFFLRIVAVFRFFIERALSASLGVSSATVVTSPQAAVRQGVAPGDAPISLKWQGFFAAVAPQFRRR